MKREFNITDSKFIYTKNELSYQEVLNEMNNAQKIVIVTYNISNKHEYLLNCIKSVPNECDVVIVTNIPQRWDYYRNENKRELAQKQIRLYLTKLKPEEIGKRVGVFFNFDNHGKIIMTDKVAYIGSANYSEESGDNVEFGIISHDTNFISFLLDELVPDITATSYPYYEYDYFPLLLESQMAISALYKLINEMHEQAYSLHDDIDGKWFIYNNREDVYSSKTCSDMLALLKSMHTISTDIYNAIITITNDNESKTCEVAELSDNVLDISKELEKLLCSSEIWDLTTYSIDDRTSDILQNEYSAEAYEEKIEYYVEKSLARATNEFQCIADLAEKTVQNIFDKLKDFKNEYVKIHTIFKGYNLREINSRIDNT